MRSLQRLILILQREDRLLYGNRIFCLRHLMCLALSRRIGSTVYIYLDRALHGCRI